MSDLRACEVCGSVYAADYKRDRRCGAMRESGPCNSYLVDLATPASAPVGETTDTERLDFIEAEDAQITQWERDLNGDVSETLWKVETVNGGFSHRDLRQAIDAARAAERRDQEEGR